MSEKLKILIVSMQYGYGDPAQGLSYEWNHFYKGLQSVFECVDFFDYMINYQKHGCKKMQSALLEEIKVHQYDVCLFILFTDQFEKEFINSLKKHTKTLCYFHDDTWRKTFVKYWAPAFSVFTTTDPLGVQKYKEIGLDNAVFFPFGVNEHIFFPDPKVIKDIDVSFVGAWHPYREWLLKKVKQAGFKVEVFGSRWPNGLVATEEMVDIFRRSKISLNLSNSVCYDLRYLLSSVYPLYNILRCIRMPKLGEQLKGRHFEIPACGTMQLSYYVDGLAQMFEFNKEIVVFGSPEELIHKIGFYLKYHDECKMIARLGYEKVLYKHTYKKRFLSVFKLLKWLD